MPCTHLLSIFNPSNYWRGGHFSIPWQPIYQQYQIPAEELIISDLRDLSCTSLHSQVDRVDPDDPSRDTLVFSLPKVIPPGSEQTTLASAFVRLDRSKPIPPATIEPYLEVVYGSTGQARGVRLANSRLIVWFNLIPAPEDNGRNWFSGSATSVQLDRQEILDPFRAAKGEWTGQDPEKRCMQVDELLLPGQSSPESPYYKVSLFNHSYRLVSHTSGAVRASMTIASEPFEYIDVDSETAKSRHLICELYRIISLYAGANYLVEELYVKGKPIVGEKEAVNLNFAVRYFAHMNMGRTEDIQQVFPVYDWFAVSSTAYPHPAYGLMTDVHIESLTHPHAGNPSQFSWQLLPSKYAKCVHLFMRGQPNGFDAQVSQYWYELIYKPLKAEIYQEIACEMKLQPTSCALI
jgi:hypothetical protein